MKALLVDDHPMVFSELQAVALSIGTGLQLVLAGSLDAARSALADHGDLDLVLLDLRHDEVQGLRLLAEIRALRPELAVVVVPAGSDNKGADSGKAPHDGAIRLLGALANRRGSFDGHLSAVSEDGLDAGLDVVDWRFRLTAHASLDVFGLTRRQQQVLGLIMEGQTNKSIARSLCLSVDTVKDHVTALMKSLKVSSRTQAVLAVTARSGAGAPGRSPRPS